jgi:inorganic pyrophosphatase
LIPQTLAEDEDELDILVMVNEPTFSGCLIETRVVGIFKMRDKGQNDYKLLGVPDTDPLFGQYRELADVPPHFLREVEHFFATYKQLEGHLVEPLGWENAESAMAEVTASVERFRAKATQILA